MIFRSWLPAALDGQMVTSAPNANFSPDQILRVTVAQVPAEQPVRAVPILYVVNATSPGPNMKNYISGDS